MASLLNTDTLVFIETKKIVMKYFLLGAFILAYTYYLLVNQTGSNLEHLFFIVIFIILLKYYDINRQISDEYQYEQENLDNFVERLKEQFATFKFRNNQNRYFIYSENILNEDREEKLNFVIRNQSLIDILKEMEYVKFYDYNSYMSLVYLLEYFLRHYYTSIENKDMDQCQQTIMNLKDVQRQIKNIFGGLSIDMPIHDKFRRNINQQLYGIRKKIVSFMNNKLFLIEKLCNKKNVYHLRTDSLATYGTHKINYKDLF
jgi:hypothetical protein